MFTTVRFLSLTFYKNYCNIDIGSECSDELMNDGGIIMNNDDSIKNFQHLLRLRTIFKQVSQLSWNITQLEKRYPLESLDGTEANDLITAYQQYAQQLARANDELRSELYEKENKS